MADDVYLELAQTFLYKHAVNVGPRELDAGDLAAFAREIAAHENAACEAVANTLRDAPVTLLAHMEHPFTIVAAATAIGDGIRERRRG